MLTNSILHSRVCDEHLYLGIDGGLSLRYFGHHHYNLDFPMCDIVDLFPLHHNFRNHAIHDLFLRCDFPKPHHDRDDVQPLDEAPVKEEKKNKQKLEKNIGFNIKMERWFEE